MENQPVQKGFTLIELMIVITIIGILASFSVPAYRDYTIRTKVRECHNLFSPLKTEIAILYSENGTLPTKKVLTDSGRVSIEKFKGDYVSSMDYKLMDYELDTATPNKGVVTCTLKEHEGLGDTPDKGGASGGKLTFIAETTTQTINWTVSTVNDDSHKLAANFVR